MVPNLTSDQIKITLTTSFTKRIFGLVWELGTPKNITYMWGFGRFLGLVIVIQVVSGFFLAFFYVRGNGAWDSVVSLTREVRGGWILRLIHRNIASFVFLILYIHFFRGIIQRSFYLKRPWISGWVIKVLTIAVAFFGYVLPWGQMSFWGVTVITNLLSILPIGKILVIWLWGGFYVSSFTCRFFYAVHFLVPFLILALAGVHLFILHFSGSTLPGGYRRFNGLLIKFRFLFTYKDVVNLVLLWGILLWMLILPDWSADPVNFVVRDLSNSPIHIQPEWYFLHLYAVLRSIPNKLGGLIGFALALVLLVVLVLVSASHSLSQFYIYNFVAWRFFGTNLVLLWLGMQPVEEPYVFLGQIAAFFYFSFFFVVLITDWINSLIL